MFNLSTVWIAYMNKPDIRPFSSGIKGILTSGFQRISKICATYVFLNGNLLSVNNGKIGTRSNRGVTRLLRGHLICPGLLPGEGRGRPQDDPRGGLLDPSVEDVKVLWVFSFLIGISVQPPCSSWAPQWDRWREA